MTTNLKYRSCRLSQTLTIGLVLALLAGCSVLGGSASYPSRYTLSAHASPAHSDAQAQFPVTLTVRPVAAPGWLDSKRMLYRLAYASDQKLAAYTQSAWADTPAELVADNLGQSLTARHLFSAVLGGDASGRSILALQLELADFSQHFSSPKKSSGRIAITATLLNTHSGQVIAQHSFAKAVPTSTADAKGGVQALTKADHQLNAAIAQWLTNTLGACQKACLSAG